MTARPSGTKVTVPVTIGKATATVYGLNESRTVRKGPFGLVPRADRSSRHWLVGHGHGEGLHRYAGWSRRPRCTAGNHGTKKITLTKGDLRRYGRGTVVATAQAGLLQQHPPDRPEGAHPDDRLIVTRSEGPRRWRRGPLARPRPNGDGSFPVHGGVHGDGSHSRSGPEGDGSFPVHRNRPLSRSRPEGDGSPNRFTGTVPFPVHGNRPPYRSGSGSLDQRGWGRPGTA